MIMTGHTISSLALNDGRYWSGGFHADCPEHLDSLNFGLVQIIIVTSHDSSTRLLSYCEGS